MTAVLLMLISAFTAMTKGLLPQLNVMRPPCATALLSAAEVQLAEVPLPTTRLLIPLVLMATGTVQDGVIKAAVSALRLGVVTGGA